MKQLHDVQPLPDDFLLAAIGHYSEYKNTRYRIRGGQLERWRSSYARWTPFEPDSVQMWVKEGRYWIKSDPSRSTTILDRFDP